MRKYVFLVLSLCIVVFIWGNSLQDAPHSSVESRWVLQWMMSFFSAVPGIDHLTMHIVRKMAYFTEYAALGFSLSAAWLTLTGKQKMATVLILGFLIASIDESIQLFSPGRSSQISDVLLDTFGVWAGAVVIYVLRKI